MAAPATEAMNESSNRQDTINEESDLSVFYEAREMWIRSGGFRRPKRERKVGRKGWRKEEIK